MKFSRLIFLTLVGLQGCCLTSSCIPADDAIKLMWNYSTKGIFKHKTPLKPVTPEEQVKWNHFTDAEIEKAPWTRQEEMRKTRYVSERPLPFHIGSATFMIPINYFGAEGELASEEHFKNGVVSEQTTGPIRFYLWDFSGYTPHRAIHGLSNDEYVSYSFSFEKSIRAVENSIKDIDLFDPEPNFQEYGLDAYVPKVGDYKNMTLAERINKHKIAWLGKSSHGGLVVIDCNENDLFCIGYGAHPVGRYAYKFYFSPKYLSRWKEIEAGVHEKVMIWLEK